MLYVLGKSEKIFFALIYSWNSLTGLTRLVTDTRLKINSQTNDAVHAIRRLVVPSLHQVTSLSSNFPGSMFSTGTNSR